MIRRRLLLLHPERFEGENHGLYAQHIASMRLLLDGHDGWEVVTADPRSPSLPELTRASDLMVVHMLGTPEVAVIISERRERGLHTVFEISDNFLALGSWLPASHALRNPLVRQQVLHNASIADGVQVYSPGLADLFGHVHARVIRFDSYVPLRRPHQTCRRPFVFGWGGTTSHRDDLARIAPAITDFCVRHSGALFSYMGDSGMFAELFGAIAPAQTRLRPFGSHDDYLEFVDELEVGLAPLADTAFNVCRSDAKFATYAARGVAAVCQASDVYRPHRERALLFHSAKDAAQMLEVLYADDAKRRELADRAYNWAARERSLERSRDQRANAYEALLSATPLPPGVPVAPGRSHLDALLDRQPFHYVGLTNKIQQLTATDPASPVLSDLRLRACLVAPEFVQGEHRPASLVRFLPS